MIDRKPQVGRFVVLESHFIHGHFRRGGRITKIAGRQISYQGLDRKGVAYRSAAICDTEEEVEKLLAFDRQARERIDALVEQIGKEKLALFQ